MDFLISLIAWIICGFSVIWFVGFNAVLLMDSFDKPNNKNKRKVDNTPISLEYEYSLGETENTAIKVDEQSNVSSTLSLGDERLNKWFEDMLNGNNAKRGHLYEHYVGYLLEQENYKVDYVGIRSNGADDGIDLIAKNDECTLIVQCKNFKEGKKVPPREVRAHQGVIDSYKKGYPHEAVRGAFFSTSGFTEKSADFAKVHGIKICRKELPRRFPVVKCKVREKNYKCYRLPADNGYYSLKINPDNGDCYCLTVKEAEDKGFKSLGVG